jgi:hypothetical protein
MKVLKQLLFAFAVTICLSLTASAQRQDDKKNTPPKDKDKVPFIQVVPKDDKKPKGNDRPKDDKKKPESIFFRFSEED